MTDTTADPTPRDPTMTDRTQRLSRFTDEIEELKLKTGRSSQERTLQVVAVVAMVGGIVLGLGAYVASLDVQATPGTNVDTLTSTSYEILALVGIAISLVGGFVYLRCSLAHFLRFWLLRQSYEQQQALADARHPD